MEVLELDLTYHYAPWHGSDSVELGWPADWDVPLNLREICTIELFIKAPSQAQYSLIMSVFFYIRPLVWKRKLYVHASHVRQNMYKAIHTVGEHDICAAKGSIDSGHPGKSCWWRSKSPLFPIISKRGEKNTRLCEPLSSPARLLLIHSKVNILLMLYKDEKYLSEENGRDLYI